MSTSRPSRQHHERLARSVVQRLVDNGFRALYAGGYVRDRLLGTGDTGDIDIATSATPDEVTALFEHTVGVGAHFGVIIVVQQGLPFEVATFRTDVGTRDGRHPESVAFCDEQTDAQRRDFTINGMFYDPLTDEVLDYVGGREDLQHGVVRAIGDPQARFHEDYLRLLRAVRFAARFRFEVEPATWEALREAADGLSGVSSERVFQETDRMLCGPNPEQAVRMLQCSGLLAQVLPEVAAMDGVEQPKEFHPEGDVLEHTLQVLAHLEKPSRCLAWSALLHDIGKPPTMVRADRIRFNNHHTVGARMAVDVLRRLHAPNALIECVEACVANHMQFMNVPRMKLSTLKRFLGRSTIDDELALHRADCLASHGMLDNYDILIEQRAKFAQEQLKPRPLLRGKDLIALGHSPGPLFRTILDAVYDLQLEEQVATREQALEWVRKRYPSG